MAVAYQLNPKADYMTAMLANMNYEGGCNPVNVCYVTGLGWKRQRDIVSQWALDDSRAAAALRDSGRQHPAQLHVLLALTAARSARLCFPSDCAATAPYPFYDRWGDSWNVNAEMVVLNQARSLGRWVSWRPRLRSKRRPGTRRPGPDQRAHIRVTVGSR